MKPLDRFHPADDRLIALYFGDEEATSEAPRAIRQHLHGCESCTWRYTELTAPLERLRQDAASEADDVFSQSRLDAQRLEILRRLESGAPASRVIPFPAPSVGTNRLLVRRPVARWIAAAAAAGLLVGVMAGRLYEFRGVVGPSVASTQAVHAPVAAANLARPEAPEPAALSGEEAFLNDMERAVNGSHIPALSVLDNMTPRVREVAVMARSVR